MILQGSVWLFIISTLITMIFKHVLPVLFADDTKLYVSISNNKKVCFKRIRLRYDWVFENSFSLCSHIGVFQKYLCLNKKFLGNIF